MITFFTDILRCCIDELSLFKGTASPCSFTLLFERIIIKNPLSSHHILTQMQVSMIKQTNTNLIMIIFHQNHLTHPPWILQPKYQNTLKVTLPYFLLSLDNDTFQNRIRSFWNLNICELFCEFLYRSLFLMYDLYISYICYKFLQYGYFLGICW